MLVAGFPCQSFSNAGRKLAFDDDRGQLFYELVPTLTLILTLTLTLALTLTMTLSLGRPALL